MPVISGIIKNMKKLIFPKLSSSLEIIVDSNFEELESFRINDLKREIDLVDSIWSDGKVTSSLLQGSSIDKTTFENLVFEKCDLANTQVLETSIHQVLFRNCRFTGLIAQDSIIENATFEKCKINLASWSGCKMKNIVFEECDLTEIDFLNCELENIEFNDCILTDGKMLESKIKKVDLRTSNVQNLKVTTFEGLITDPTQSVDILLALGAEIRWKE